MFKLLRSWALEIALIVAEWLSSVWRVSTVAWATATAAGLTDNPIPSRPCFLSQPLSALLPYFFVLFGIFLGFRPALLTALVSMDVGRSHQSDASSLSSSALTPPIDASAPSLSSLSVASLSIRADALSTISKDDNRLQLWHLAYNSPVQPLVWGASHRHRPGVIYKIWLPNQGWCCLEKVPRWPSVCNRQLCNWIRTEKDWPWCLHQRDTTVSTQTKEVLCLQNWE